MKQDAETGAEGIRPVTAGEAQVRREQEAEEREFSGISAEADRHELEFEAWSKTQEEQGQQRKLEETLAVLRRDLGELREAEEKRRREEAFSRLLERRPRKPDSYLMDVFLALAPAAAVLSVAYLGRDKKDAAPTTECAKRDDASPDDAVAVSAGAPRELDPDERELTEKVVNGTATEEEVRALATLLWRGLHGLRRAG